MITRIGIKVSVLTPLHIGTGVALTEDFDYVCHNGYTYRIDIDRLAEELYTRDPKLTEQLLRIPPGQLLRPEDLRPDSPYIRYVLPGEPGGQQFREAIKDAHDRPYVPGSSLKGALRTAIAWHAWEELDLSLSKVKLGKDRKFAAQDLEAEIFGRDPEKGKKSPHHDLLRALRVSDSDPVAIERLKIYQVRVWTPKGGAAPISVEAIMPGTEIDIFITIDESLFSEWAEKQRVEGFPFKHRDWLIRIPEIARKRAELRAESELNFWGKDTGPMDFYSKLLEACRKAKRGFPLQLGFGTGWEGTTIGAPLREDPKWPEVHRRYELGKIPRTKRQTPPDEFPRSRRIVVNTTGKPVQPLGWVWIKWEEA